MERKFSGVSNGGFYGGTSVFSKNHKLFIYKDHKTEKWGYSIKKKFFPYNVNPIILIFPLFDILFYIINYQSHILRTVGEFVGGQTEKVSSTVSFEIPMWVGQICIYLAIFTFILFLYYFFFKGVRYWHGCEHKIISAAENEDMDNAKDYSPINDNCGGCYLFTIYLTMGAYWIVFFAFTNFEVPIGLMSSVIFMMMIEAKFFHKYNTVGIWIGRWFQKHISVKEPHRWQLDIGIEGMKHLVDVEYNGKPIGEIDG